MTSFDTPFKWVDGMPVASAQYNPINPFPDGKICVNCKHFHGWYSYSQGAIEGKCLYCDCADYKT